MTIAADITDPALSSGVLADDTYEGAPPASAVSWGAIIAGAVAAVATTIILLVLGTGIGFSMVSPWYGAGASAATVGVSAVVWLVIVQWLSSGVGGFLAGRLRSRWVRLHTDEMFFRDTAHGFLAWSAASVAGALIFASVAATGIGGVVRGTVDVTSAAAAGGAAQAGTQGAASRAENGIMEYFVDSLFRSTTAPQSDRSDYRAEAVRILATSMHGGQVTLSSEDRTYLAQMVATRTGLTQPEAEQRIDGVIVKLNDAATKAKQAADIARKRAAQLAIVSALAMLVGAFIASTAAAIGGRMRDEY
ncbi:MAG: hypothetical protein JWM91_2514 [Rhodospirillales bacterium]|nr:hypothetical protein [Rhodospirillales bacterium]